MKNLLLEPWPRTSKIKACFFNRHAGKKDIFEKVGVPTIYSLKQVHSDKVIVLSAPQASKKTPNRVLSHEGSISADPEFTVVGEGDALVTQLANTALAVHTADCIPLLAHAGDVVGACHGGWRGISANIIPKWLREIQKLGIEMSQLKVALGPSIGVCHFEVGIDVAERILSPEGLAVPMMARAVAEREHPDPNKVFIDLPALATWQLTHAGVLPENIVDMSKCTYCDERNFFSYRRDGGTKARLEAVIVRRSL